MLKIQVILGSTREGRMGDKVAQWFMKQAGQRQDVQLELLDLRDFPLPMFNEPKSPSMMQSVDEYASEEAKTWVNKIAEGDGFIWLSPEYNNSYPAVLKNALDYPFKEWAKKPVGMLTYSGGPSGGIRAAQHLRHVAIELQMHPIRDSISFPALWSQLDESGQIQPGQNDNYVGGFLDQLAEWGNLLKAARQP